MPEATPKTNTMSPNDFLACIVELDEQTRGKDRSVAKLRTVRARMEKAGCDMKALDLALSLRKLDSGEAEIRLRNALRYARWLEMKVGDQGSLFSDDADQPAEKARAEYSEAQAKAEGYEAGKAGRDGRVHRFQQGSALAQRFYEGWLSGQALLAEQGVELYIDWKDASMPPEPNRETASRIQHRIKTCDWFLFLATANSMTSRWCPWELGYADGQKQTDRIAIVQTSDSTTTHGNEYMQLYRRVDTSSAGELLWVPAGSNQGQFVRNVPFL